MKHFYFIALITVLLNGSITGQVAKHIPGTPCKDCVSLLKNQPSSVQNGNGIIATSYTTTACGLNFTQASVRLHQRVTTSLVPQTGVPQPATFSITGIPPCAVIVKAFLYAGTSGNGIAVTANITNPLSTNANFPMTIIGAHIDKCWSYSGTFTYRADVTSIISGNGNYTISGLPVAIGSNDTDGATLIVIYRDVTQTYTGSFVIADGAWVSTGSLLNTNISGFNVCGPTTLTSNFMIVADLQKFGTSQVYLNSSSSNLMYAAPSQNMWDFIQAPGAPAFAGQTTATYGMGNSSDCFAIAAAGMYFRTACNTCTASGFAVTTVASSSCTIGSATATPSGGVGPYTYTWSPTGGNASTVSGVPPGIYTVTVRDASCAVGVSTINIPSSPTVAVNNQTICMGNTATVTASGASTYSWNTGATSAQILVSPSVTTVYTVTGSNGACSNTKTVSVTVNTSPTVNAVSSTSTICAGQTVTLTASGANTYFWSTGSTNTVIVVAPTSNATYTVTGFVPGCSGTKTISITVNSIPNPSITSSSSVLCSGSATLTASGALTYSWSTGATTSQIVVSPTVNTTYTLVGSNGACSVNRTITVVAGTTPVMSAMTSNSFICAGQTVTLSATGAISYTYNPGGITGNPIALSPASSITYTVLGSNGGPCIGSAFIAQSVSPCTGIDLAKFQKVYYGVFPNPNNGHFMVVAEKTEGKTEVEIYNALGQLISHMEMTESSLNINLQDQADGIYHLRILQNGKQQYKAKIVKE